MRTYRIAATRGRCDGDWYESEHFQLLEIGGGEISNTITSVAKDNYLYEEHQESKDGTREDDEKDDGNELLPR